MKRCSYCGAEYPDDATECAIDQTPFVEVQSEPVHFNRPTFAVFSEHQIPVSLSLVSYIFFAGGIIQLLAGFAIAIYSVTPALVLMFLEGIFCIFISRGLRKCSARWRFCALILLWWYFGVFAYLMCRIFLAYIDSHGQAHDTLGAFFSSRFFFMHCVYFVFQIWAFRVLIRPDIRELF